MNSEKHWKFDEIVKKFLGAGLPKTISGQANFTELPSDARRVILRFLTLMKRSACAVTEINAHMIWLLFTVTPSMLPSAWGGSVPPLTSSGRHRRLDAYVLAHPWPSNVNRPIFIDMGCGFPPLTTVDTAKHLPGWQIYGVDHSFSRYVLYDIDGRYACFNRSGEFEYFQSPATPLNDTSDAVRARFQTLFTDIYSQLEPESEYESQSVEIEGHRLIINHVRDYETENLRFINSEVEDLDIPPARFIRCMNMLLYYSKKVRERILSALGERLDTDGLLMVGFNHPFGIYARYAIYAKSVKGITPCEFSFSMDNLRPIGIGPWLALSDDDKDAALLADLTGAIRSDRQFWPDFDRHVDHLREKSGICKRGDDGFNYFPKGALKAAPKTMIEKSQELWTQLETESYKKGAIAALRRAGYTAWENQAGDISVRPPLDSLDAVI